MGLVANWRSSGRLTRPAAPLAKPSQGPAVATRGCRRSPRCRAFSLPARLGRCGGL